MDILDILWNSSQEGRIWQAEDRIDSATLTVETLKNQVTDALERLDHANLVTLALWELIAERHSSTVEQLRAKVAEIDLRDGVQDGQFGGQAAQCTGCGRPMNSKRPRCMYCGMPRRGLGLMDAVAPDPDSTQ